MGLDAESSDLSERIRARAAALPRVETAVPPVPPVAPVLAHQDPPVPSPAALAQAARVARFNELVASGMTEEEADDQLRAEAVASAVTPEPSAAPPNSPTPRKRGTTRADLDEAVRRLDLAEAGITRVSARLDEMVKGYNGAFQAIADETAARAADVDGLFELLATEIAKLKRMPPTERWQDSILDVDAIARRDPEPEIPSLPRYRFWSSRAGLFISWPVRKVWRGLVWVFTSPGSGPYE